MFSAYDLREKLRLARFRARERVACSLYKLYKLYKANNLCCETGVVVPPLFWDRRVQEFQNPTWRTGAVGSLGTPLGDLPGFSHHPYMLCFWFWDPPLEFPSVLQKLQLDEVYKSISTITRTQTPLHAHRPESQEGLFQMFLRAGLFKLWFFQWVLSIGIFRFVGWRRMESQGTH
jgi:hypothetical protein